MPARRPLALLAGCLCLWRWQVEAAEPASERNNWAVLVDTSRYWYNYRHVANTLSFYHTIKRLGVPDSQIILMMAEDMPCNPRNVKPGMVFNDRSHNLNLYGEQVEVDYRGDEVSVENFIRLLTGRHPPNTPRNKRLLTDSMSNVFIFITGHSGDEFIKFQDWEEITSTDIADAFAQMHKQRRYKKVFWVSDTCQASTLQNQFYSPEIVAIGSSAKNQNSYSHHMDPQLGVAVIDRFTYYSLDFMNKLTLSSKSSLKTFMDIFDPKLLYADPQMRTDLFSDDISNTLLTEFFASTGRMRFQNTSLQLARAAPATEGTCAMLPSAAHGRATVASTGLQTEQTQEGAVPDLLLSKLALLRDLGGGAALPASFEAVSAPPPGGGPASAMTAAAAGCALAFGALAWLLGAVL